MMVQIPDDEARTLVTADRLAQIRARAHQVAGRARDHESGYWLASEDVPWLLAEVERLTSERDAVVSNLDDERVILGEALNERDEARAAIALQAESVENAAAAIARVEALHKPRLIEYSLGDNGERVDEVYECAECQPPMRPAVWPCPTRAALRGESASLIANAQPGADEDGFGGDAPEPYDGPRLVTDEPPEAVSPQASPVPPDAANLPTASGLDVPSLVTTDWLVEVLAERDEARAAIARVEALCDEAEAQPHATQSLRVPLWVEAVRAALRPETSGAVSTVGPGDTANDAGVAGADAPAPETRAALRGES